MEILHKTSDKRTVLAALGEGEDAAQLRDDLHAAFNVIGCSSADEALEVMNEQFNCLSAAIIDIDMASDGNCAFLQAVARERCFDTIPVLAVSFGAPEEQQELCLKAGATDVIEAPCRRAILEHRVTNAVQLKRSATFYEIESMLQRLPSMIFLKDADGRYVFSTQYWHHLDMGDDPKWTIRGKTDVDIRKDRENAMLAMEADREIMRTGKGTSYVIEINVDGVQEFVQLIKEPVFDEAGNITGIIALGNDVTESEKMKRELARYARMDALTGVGNRRAFDEFLDSLPERTDYPFAVISADCDGLKTVNDTFGHLVGDEYIHMAAIVLRAGVPKGSPVFRTGGDEFVAFVPGATAEQALELVASMRHRATYFKLSHGEAVVSYGVAIIEGPSDDLQAALDLADRRMYEDKASHKR